ncbi:MAG: cytochrome P450 [Trebonia sp.]
MSEITGEPPLTGECPYYPMARDPRRPLDPPAEYQRLREQAPVSRVRVWDGSSPWLVTRYRDVRKALAEPQLHKDPRLPGFPHISPSSRLRSTRVLPFSFRPDAEYLVQRRLLVRDFSQRRMQALRPFMEQVVNEQLDALLAGPNPADLHDNFALPVATHVICKVLGIAPHGRERLHGLSRIIGSRSASQDRVADAASEMERFFRDLVAANLRTPEPGLIGRIVDAEVRPGRLAPADAAATFQLLFFAGHGPSAYMIGLGLVALLRHPAELEELRSADPQLLEHAVDELLRYVTVSHNGRQRAATADITVGGQLIRAGEGVLIQLDAANRDPMAFDHPDQLDFHRSGPAHVALGRGLHICTGQWMGRILLQAVFGVLAARVPSLRLAVPFEQLRFKESEALIGLHELPVTW